MPTLEQVLKLYPNDVKIIHKSFPLRSHQFAQAAELAALAAGEQGKFWEYHAKLFESFSSLNEQKFTEIAKELGLDMERFEADRANSDYLQRIQTDLQVGLDAGVRGTPTIFVNGKKLKNRSIPGFSSAIEAELRKAGKK